MVFVIRSLRPEGNSISHRSSAETFSHSQQNILAWADEFGLLHDFEEQARISLPYSILVISWFPVLEYSNGLRLRQLIKVYRLVDCFFSHILWYWIFTATTSKDFMVLPQELMSSTMLKCMRELKFFIYYSHLGLYDVSRSGCWKLWSWVT